MTLVILLITALSQFYAAAQVVLPDSLPTDSTLVYGVNFHQQIFRGGTALSGGNTTISYTMIINKKGIKFFPGCYKNGIIRNMYEFPSGTTVKINISTRFSGRSNKIEDFVDNRPKVYYQTVVPRYGNKTITLNFNGNSNEVVPPLFYEYKGKLYSVKFAEYTESHLAAP